MIYALIPKTGPLILLLKATTEDGLTRKIVAEHDRQNGIATTRKMDHVSLERYMEAYRRVSITIVDLDDNA